MFSIKEIHIPRSKGANLAPIAVAELDKPFEDAIQEALFSFPYKPEVYYYVINVREENGEEFLLIIDPDLKPKDGELFVSVIEGAPVIRKFDSRLHREWKILGTLAHASKAGSIDI